MDDSFHLLFSHIFVPPIRPHDSRPRLKPEFTMNDADPRTNRINQRCYTILPQLAAADVNF